MTPMQAISLARAGQIEKAMSLFAHVLGMEQRRGNPISISAGKAPIIAL